MRMRLSSRVGALFWLGLLMAPLAALTGSVARADAPREIFGAHWIERVPGKNSYILRLSAGDGGSTGFIALRCIADEQALTVQIGAPNGANRMQPRQTVTVWSDKTPAVDVVAAANNYLLPAWMIGFGVWLVIASKTERLTPAHV